MPIIIPYSANLPSDVLWDHGTFTSGNILIASSTNMGVTKGPPKFDPAWNIESLMFDGRDAPIKGLDRKFYGPAKFSATMIEFGPSASGNQIGKFEVGGSAVDSGTTPNTLTTITPKVGRGVYASGDYLTYLRIVFARRGITAGAGVKSFAGICFPCALVTKWDITGQDKDAALIAVEFEARKDMASGITADAPYLIEYYETIA